MLFPIAVYTAPNWKYFFINRDMMFLGWGSKRLVVAWWLLNPFRNKA